jgi:hypothetical protein
MRLAGVTKKHTSGAEVYSGWYASLRYRQNLLEQFAAWSEIDVDSILEEDSQRWASFTDMLT